MTNGASVLWKILKGLAKKWPEMVVKLTIVTHRLGDSDFNKCLLWNKPQGNRVNLL